MYSFYPGDGLRICCCYKTMVSVDNEDEQCGYMWQGSFEEDANSNPLQAPCKFIVRYTEVYVQSNVWIRLHMSMYTISDNEI